MLALARSGVLLEADQVVGEEVVEAGPGPH